MESYFMEGRFQRGGSLVRHLFKISMKKINLFMDSGNQRRDFLLTEVTYGQSYCVRIVSVSDFLPEKADSGEI